MKKILIIGLLGYLMLSCGTSKKAKTASKEKRNPSEVSVSKDNPKATKQKETINLKNMSPVELYIYTYAEIAQEEMKRYGIPASITIAQGILESGSGNGNLTKQSNNHFGIKCNGWQGQKVYHDDDEAQECFRKYKDPKHSFRDHSLFLFERNRYSFLFDYKTDDYSSWAKGLRQAGYATDPKYPDKLISLIERYRLFELDTQVLKNTAHQSLPKPKYNLTKKTSIYHVQKGDTLYNISKKFGISVEELKSINKLRKDQILIGQELKLK